MRILPSFIQALPQRRLVCDNSTREERRDGLVFQIFALLFTILLAAYHWIVHPCPPSPKKGVWVFPYQRLTNTNELFGQTNTSIWFDHLEEGMTSADFTYLSSLPPPTHPTTGCLQERVGMCVGF